jgi:hypothetical protein
MPSWFFFLPFQELAVDTGSDGPIPTITIEDVDKGEPKDTSPVPGQLPAEWINQFLDRFWLIYEPVLSATIVASVDQVLSINCPPSFDSFALTQFTRNTKSASAAMYPLSRKRKASGDHDAPARKHPKSS